jgi:plasmid maintenance system antidote protein VapI
MKLGRTILSLVLIKSGLFFALPINAEENRITLDSLWGSVKSESENLINKSLDITTDFANELGKVIDSEIANLKELQIEPTQIDVRDKIDTVRIYVDDISILKKQEVEASSFTLISKSKKDFRIEIDEVLKEIEPVLFDGEVVNYASKIRNARQQISQLKKKKVELNEDLVFAPEQGSLLKSSKSDIREEIKRVDLLISKSETLIDELEFDLKKKMSALGIDLTREQIRVMTTRVDGDELARSFAIFDVTRQISNTLGQLMKENSFSAQTTVKYYGTYVILSEILGYSQREYIDKIKTLYLPAIAKIEDDIEASIDFAEKSLGDTTSDSNKDILKTNIRSNQFSLEVVQSYRTILKSQIESLENALERTEEQIMVAYSTYDTAANSANLVNLISETQDTFDRIMNMQVPDIIPFENTELELKFQEISDQILDVSDA